MEQQILQLIEAEVERRVQERMTTALEKIGRTFDISLQQLLRTANETTVNTGNRHVCNGVTANKQKCTRHVKDGGGYCHWHVKQKPVPLMTASRSQLSLLAPNAVHTHTLPPMFLAGCPACERGKNVRIDI